MNVSKGSGGIKVGDIITIDYNARLKNGRTILSTKNRSPLTFKVGYFSPIRGFNLAVVGMKIGELKKIKISPTDAFGEIDQELICYIPLDDLPKYIRVGQRVLRKGRDIKFSVLEVNSDKGFAVLDGNHFLAGKDLEFSIRILSIKYPPTPERVAKKVEKNFREIAKDFLNIPLAI